MEATRDYINHLYKEQVPFVFIIDFELKKPLVYRLDHLPKDIEFSTPLLKWEKPQTKEIDKSKFFLDRMPISFDEYLQAFDLVKKEISYGNSFLLNLTFSTPIVTNITFDEYYQLSDAAYKLKYKDQFLVCSPESFVKIKNNRIYTYPMKGTIEAQIPNAAEKILTNHKELSEHYTIVDLLRNDLSIVAKNVNVERFRYIDYVHSSPNDLLQVSSEIIGDIKEDYLDNFGDLLFALLPAGSISGAPKKKTLEIIATAEHGDRGYYTGIFGVFDGSQVDSGVMIRYIENTDKGLLYRSGGGITFQSDAMTEYLELIQKVYLPFSQKPSNQHDTHSSQVQII